MKRFTIYMISILSLTLWISSCQDISFDSTTACKDPGKEAKVHLRLTSPQLSVGTKGLPENLEKNIERLYILFFYPDGRLVSKTKINDLDTDMIIDAYTISGDGMNIVALANYGIEEDGDVNQDMENALDSIKSFEEYTKICYQFIPKEILEPKMLPMTGITENVTIQAGDNNSTSIQLTYLHTKITLKMIDKTTHQNAQFVGWRIGNAKKSSYIYPQTTEVESDYYSMNDFYTFEKEAENNSQMIDIYVLENLKGNRISYDQLSSEKKKYYDELNDQKKALCNSQREGKSIFAPEDATFIETKVHFLNQNLKGDDLVPIYDQVAKDGQYYRVFLKIYLGANEINDYNIERGKHYTYNVTFYNDFNVSIDSYYDTNIDTNTLGLEVLQSSSLTLDAHASVRNLLLKSKNENIQNLEVEILDAAERNYKTEGFNATWLKISPLMLSRSQIKQNGNDGLWQEDVQSGYFCHPKYIPHKDRRLWLENGYEKGSPSRSFKSPLTPYSPPEGVVLGSSEYPEEDDELPLSLATHRMCYKITDIMNTSASDQFVQECVISLNADEFESEVTSMRNAFIHISYFDKKKNKKEDLKVPLSQISPLEVGRISYRFHEINSFSYVKLYVESIEESRMFLYPDLPSSFQSTTIMQWGFNNQDILTQFTYKHGYAQLAETIFKSGVNIDNETGETSWNKDAQYRDLYRSGMISGNNQFNKITEPSTFSTTGAPYFYPDLVHNLNNSDYFDNTFNTDAPRYCFEKNRDLDGDGKILTWETKWFLPSLDELQQTWVAQENIQNTNTAFGNGYYWTSTEKDKYSTYMLGFNTGHCQNINKTQLTVSLTNGSVRCVRRDDYHSLNKGAIQIEDGRIYLDFREYPSHMVSYKSKGAGIGYINNYKDFADNSATVFARLIVAKEDYTSSTNEVKDWNWAVGITNPFSGPYEADDRVGTAAGNYVNVNPTSIIMKNVHPNRDSGCNAYYENVDGSDKNHWRLPNKRELVYMIIASRKIGTESLANFVKMNGDYFSADQRRDGNSNYINTVNTDGVSSTKGKNYVGLKVRCVREDYTALKFRLYYNANGGYNAPGSKSYYGEEKVIIPNIIPQHPNRYRFICWQYEDEQGIVNYNVGDTIIMPTKNMTLKALWKIE